MRKGNSAYRILSLLLAIAMLLCIPAPAQAQAGGIRLKQVDNSRISASPLLQPAEEISQEPDYDKDELVRVSIALDEAATLDAGFSTQSVAVNRQAMAYREALQQRQEAVTASMEQAIGSPVDVVWNLTLAANIISANVPYGQLETIRQIPGVAAVELETRFDPCVVSQEEADPNMATSSSQIGSAVAYAAGYTGAGTRIAVIDTGLDLDHQSFSASGLQYSLSQRAAAAGMTEAEYMEQLDLLSPQEISQVLNQLNLSHMAAGVKAEDLYCNLKVPFGYNYIDNDLDISHDHDNQGEHGSHVEGIAAANAYIPQADGTFAPALEAVKTQGVAPDAQILVMKVFGKSGGAFESDYMAAIEDAIVLGCDAVNLSLGAPNPGYSHVGSSLYQEILDRMASSDTVVTMSAGNSGSWVENAYNGGHLYAEDVSMQTLSSPSSYTNSLSVASVDNTGGTGAYLQVDNHTMFYTEPFSESFSNAPITTIRGEHDYIFLDGLGTPADFAAVGDAAQGKIVLCARGDITFAEKANAATAAGAIATVIYNNTSGTINMDLTDYRNTAPCVSISQADGAWIRANSTPVTGENGQVLYATGKMTVGGEGDVTILTGDGAPYTMSDFSGWGIPGSMEMKPEITAPGGNIYSVNGAIPGGTAYENMSGTSMASPQVAGMAALVAQYIKENQLDEQTGLRVRALAQSLLMSTASALVEDFGEHVNSQGASSGYYPILRQGAGLANVGAAATADSYIWMGEDATASYADGKVKAELMDDPDRTGSYTFSFTIHNLDGQERQYVLSADLFTQDVWEGLVPETGDTALYMDTRTVALQSSATWRVNGQELSPQGPVEQMDFNGDGLVNTEDAQAMLDYITGIRQELEHLDLADLNGDGSVTSHDAHLFLVQMSSGLLTVPAYGAATVQVCLTLTQAQKQALEAQYACGAYIEGFVFAKPLPTWEGEQGTVHSIPLLGFFGSWTDPSMFEVGSYAEFANGQESRTPYLGTKQTNTLGIQYAGDHNLYCFGGNPLVPDQVYHPERNAINGQRGDTIRNWQVGLIRNAADSVTTVTDVTHNLERYRTHTGELLGAYYHVNAGAWQRQILGINMYWMPSEVPEGTQVRYDLVMVPEYYVDNSGNTDWASVHEGAKLSIPMVIDNTAPVVEEAMASIFGNQMTVTASDNQYVAAVVLYNITGTQALSYAGSYTDIQPGQEATYTLDLTGVRGQRFLLQVADYAMNTVTYELTLDLGEPEPLPDRIAFALYQNQWVSFDKNTQPDPETGLKIHAPSEYSFRAATMADHHIFACTESGDLYVLDEENLTDVAPIRNLGYGFCDLAYCPLDDTVYGLTVGGELAAIDRYYGRATILGTLGVPAVTLACDEAGNFYCNRYDSNEIYSFTLETLSSPSLLTTVDIAPQAYAQSMEIDPNTGLLCWTSFYVQYTDMWQMELSYYYEIDPKTGAYTKYQDLKTPLACLIIPDRAGKWDHTQPKPTEIFLSDTQLTVAYGNSWQLNATVLPWNIRDRSVTWTSSNEAVATVDETGMVTGVGEGTATIQAASVLDSSLTASCEVSVLVMDVTLKGVLQSLEGQKQFFQWNLAEDAAWTGGTALDTSINSSTLDTRNHVLYVADTENRAGNIHKVNPDTGEILATAVNSSGCPLHDMAYSQVFSTADKPLACSAYTYFIMTMEDPMNLLGYGLYMLPYTMAYGDGYFPALASMGPATIEYQGTTYDTEHMIALGNNGNLWNIYLYPSENGSSGNGYDAILTHYTGNLLSLGVKFPGDKNQNILSSMVLGEDGNLYLSAFTGNTNELYRLTLDEAAGTYDAKKIGTMGAGVYPASLYAVTRNQPEANSSKPTLHLEDAILVSPQQITAQDLAQAEAYMAEATEAHSAAPGMLPTSTGTPEEDEKTVTVQITAKDELGTDVASTNGLATVQYDTDALTLQSILVHGDCHAAVESSGAVRFAYAGVHPIAAGQAVATLEFAVKSTSDTTVTVLHEQTNQLFPAHTEEVTVSFQHLHTELRNALDATCTEDGYTGDTYCTDCGALVAQGQPLPALGHRFGNWTEIETPDCFHTGLESRTCQVCGEQETRELPPRQDHCPSAKFLDLNLDAWYHEATDFAIAKGLMQGVSDTQFSPEASVTRAQLVTILYRLEGVPQTGGEIPFTDVQQGQYYTQAIAWAFQKGLVKGVRADLFQPNGAITREQLVTILARYAVYKGETISSHHPLEFPDADSVSEYAQEPMQWAVATGLIQGMDGKLNPKGTATRAQAAAVMMRLAELLEM